MEFPSLDLQSFNAPRSQLILDHLQKMRLAQVLKVLDNVMISKDKEAVTSVLISLPCQLTANSALALLNFLSVILLLIG